MSRDRIAFLYMSVSVLATSAEPLIIILGNGGTSPFVFTLMWRGAGALGILIALLVFFRQTLTDYTARVLLLRACRSWRFALLCATELSFFFYVFSFGYIDPAIAAILYGSSPVVVVVAGMLLFRTEGRFYNTTWGMALPFCVAFTGMVFLTLSQSGHSGTFDPSLGTLGIATAILGAILTGLRIALTMKIASQFRSDYEANSAASGDELEFFAILAFTIVISVLSLPGLAIGATVMEEAFDVRLLVVAGIAGLVISSVERIVFRRANLLTSNLGINALFYTAPVLALTWLFIFSLVGDILIDYVVIGAAGVIAGNMLINFQAEIRFGFRSLIVALWVCGAFVYFREALAEQLALQYWLWPPGEYFTAVGLAATVFTLILSFRAARLVTRTSDEANRTFALFSRTSLLAQGGAIDGDVRSFIMRIDSPEDPQDLVDAYESAQQIIGQAYFTADSDADRRELARAAGELDALAHSRQEGQDFGEYVALVTFAAITVALILFALDAGAIGWNGFLTEMFTVLFSAVIIFLVVNIWDLQRERGAPVLRRKAAGDGYTVAFRDAVARRFEQAVSIVVLIAMTFTVGWLLWEKWLG